MPDVAAMLAEFHGAFGQHPGHGDVHNSALRRKLHEEEHAELIEAIDASDLVGIAQELADVVYVAYGTAYSLGIPLDAVLAEVHRANMSKMGDDGRPVLREDGKVLKGPNFRPPDVAAVISPAEAWKVGMIHGVWQALVVLVFQPVVMIALLFGGMFLFAYIIDTF